MTSPRSQSYVLSRLGFEFRKLCSMVTWVLVTESGGLQSAVVQLLKRLEMERGLLAHCSDWRPLSSGRSREGKHCLANGTTAPR